MLHVSFHFLKCGYYRVLNFVHACFIFLLKSALHAAKHFNVHYLI